MLVQHSSGRSFGGGDSNMSAMTASQQSSHSAMGSQKSSSIYTVCDDRTVGTNAVQPLLVASH